MAKIFLSYRRQDAAYVAQFLYDRLRAHFGPDAIFMDIDAIPFGVDFREHIKAAVDECGILLAVIGRHWAGEAGAARRIDDPRDFVRIEIESALERNLPVVPILIDHARMPGEVDLPPSLARLAYRNALDLDPGRDFDHNVNRLIQGIERLIQPAQPPPSQPQKELTNSIGMTLTLILSGEFLMGSDESDPDAFDNEFLDKAAGKKQKHRVRISRPFYLGVTEVTQGQYQAVMGENPSTFKGSDDLPVEKVSWLDAVKFCNKLSEREGRKPYYRIAGDTVTIAGGNGYRLPTEAEWEYACRAGRSTRYPSGDDENGLGEYAWYEKNSDSKTHPVGQKKRNEWGLYDMLGNVWEWCWDGYTADYYKQSPVDDPPGAAQAALRVIRGGSWFYAPAAPGRRTAAGTCR